MLKENLAILRNIHGYSQEEIAEKINISRQAYAKWESGATVPDIEKCSLLAAVYGVTIDSLIKTETADGIGMIPPCLLDKIRPIGNAAGEGAKMCALSEAEFENSKKLAKGCEFLELASMPEFQDYYVDCLTFGEEEED